MSDAKPAVAETKSTETGSKGGGVMQLVIVAVVVVVLVLGAVGGAVFWLMKSGRLPMQAGAAPAPVVPKKVDPPKTRMVMLDPLLVNLADPGGAGYLRVVMAVSVEELPLGKDAKPKEEKSAEKGKAPVSEDDVKMRDTALGVLGRQSSEHLLSADGKEELKAQLMAALKAHVPGVKVDEILFTEFLVQR